MNKWNSRKVWVAVGTAAAATGLLAFGKIDASIWQWTVSITVGAYLAGQGLTDAVAALKK